jgi:uncharacterized membrane protein
MPLFRKSDTSALVGDVRRIELFSDAVIAIIITLLILEIHAPELHTLSFAEVRDAMIGLAPKLGSFTFSFLTVAVFWVNHHHFFHEMERSDWRFLWYNNALLFWLSLVPFTTGFLGANLFNPWVAAIYCFVLFMAAVSFSVMTYHGLFGGLVHDHIAHEHRRTHFRHGLIGVACYGLATVLAPVVPSLSIGLMIFVPLYYIAPRLMHNHDGMTHDHDHEHHG